jgi:hypothetical protein
LVLNPENANLLKEFHQYMKENGASERHQVNELLVMFYFANHLGLDNLLRDIKTRQQITSFLDSKRKPKKLDPDEKWITAWNDYLGTVKHFVRWLHNQQGRDSQILPSSEWVTPNFANIKKLRTKRLSPYSETEIWDLPELLSIVKYEQEVRNKAALTLFWDLDARNHEVTLLKIKNIRLRGRYGEGEVPFEAKTGSGPILLTMSFPYVRDWLNKHPAKNNPEAHIICNLYNGAPVRPNAMWRMMKQLRARIIRLLEKGEIVGEAEREKMQFLLRTKKWNPYCIRHSAISHDSDYLPEFALRKRVRWSMNSKQPSRYIKRSMGDFLRKNILAHNGIVIEGDSEEGRLTRRPFAECPNCRYINSMDCNLCAKCANPLTFDGMAAVGKYENNELEDLRREIKLMREESSTRLVTVLTWLQQNPLLLNVKPEELLKLQPRKVEQ